MPSPEPSSENSNLLKRLLETAGHEGISGLILDNDLGLMARIGVGPLQDFRTVLKGQVPADLEVLAGRVPPDVIKSLVTEAFAGEPDGKFDRTPPEGKHTRLLLKGTRSVLQVDVACYIDTSQGWASYQLFLTFNPSGDGK